MDLFLNELSLLHQSHDREGAIRRMDAIVEIVRKCSGHGVSGALRTLRDFLSCSLCPDYTIRHWLGDGSVAGEKRTRFKSAVTKGSFVEEWIAKGEDKEAILCEFQFDGVRVYGLGA